MSDPSFSGDNHPISDKLLVEIVLMIFGIAFLAAIVLCYMAELCHWVCCKVREESGYHLV